MIKKAALTSHLNFLLPISYLVNNVVAEFLNDDAVDVGVGLSPKKFSNFPVAEADVDVGEWKKLSLFVCALKTNQ